MGEDRTQPHLVTKKVKGTSEALVAQGLEHAFAERRVDRSNRSQSYIFYIYISPLFMVVPVLYLLCGVEGNGIIRY